ncbi:SBF-like CPA transporter family-domain-containing protein [Lipomyces chichibuensis]|uniref:SBF-like CPA transporter family-domain-containing protein n=1 Tax=Lipomyces chichibuensis TaxID=1546026 RepID=UPI0033431D1A
MAAETSPEGKDKPKAVKFLLKVFWFLVSEWFVIGMGVFIALAYKFPTVAKNYGHIRADISIQYGAVAIIFLISGLNIPRQKLVTQAAHWQAHIVTQVISFLVTPAIAFGFASAIRASNNPNINEWILVGIIITGCTPTTVSSNVVMTREARGNESLSLIEVSIGNIMGAFITPALVQMFLSKHTGFAYGNPTNSISLQSLYARVMKQLGIGVFIPLFVGQVIQFVFPNQTKWVLTKFKLAKVGSFCLLLIIWSSFSNSFASGAFETVSHASVIMVCFLNVGFYLLFTAICFLAARFPGLSEKYHFSRPDTVSIMLCGAAKTVALGVPLINAQYGSSSDAVGYASIALVLYQGEQILVAQVLVPIFRGWIEREIEAKKLQVQADLEKKTLPEEDLSVEAQAVSDEKQHESTSTSGYSSDTGEASVVAGSESTEKK